MDKTEVISESLDMVYNILRISKFNLDNLAKNENVREIYYKHLEKIEKLGYHINIRRCPSNYNDIEIKIYTLNVNGQSIYHFNESYNMKQVKELARDKNIDNLLD